MSTSEKATQTLCLFTVNYHLDPVLDNSIIEHYCCSHLSLSFVHHGDERALTQWLCPTSCQTSVPCCYLYCVSQNPEGLEVVDLVSNRQTIPQNLNSHLPIQPYKHPIPSYPSIQQRPSFRNTPLLHPRLLLRPFSRLPAQLQPLPRRPNPTTPTPSSVRSGTCGRGILL